MFDLAKCCRAPSDCVCRCGVWYARIKIVQNSLSLFPSSKFNMHGQCTRAFESCLHISQDCCGEFARRLKIAPRGKRTIGLWISSPFLCQHYVKLVFCAYLRGGRFGGAIILKIICEARRIFGEHVTWSKYYVIYLCQNKNNSYANSYIKNFHKFLVVFVLKQDCIIF